MAKKPKRWLVTVSVPASHGEVAAGQVAAALLMCRVDFMHEGTAPAEPRKPAAPPRRTEIEDLREALAEAATSLETASRWSKDMGGLSELRLWAANRARVARRALADLEVA